jgi:hypothetical protein
MTNNLGFNNRHSLAAHAEIDASAALKKIKKSIKSL